MQLLFSYGTLQKQQVQISSFGRVLIGQKDVLIGYKLEALEITDSDVLATSAQQYHPIAFATGNEQDKVEGMVFEISEEELEQADRYEVDDYQRVESELGSGKKAWVYIAKQKGQ